MRKLIGILILLSLLLASCVSSEKIDIRNMTDEQVLSLMESEGHDIYNPRFSCIYNNRVIYGPNYTPENEIVETEEITITEEPEQTIENSPGELPSDFSFNSPIEYDIPENAFVSESTTPDDELDILAQWDAFIEEENNLEKPTTEESVEAVETEETTEEIVETAETTEEVAIKIETSEVFSELPTTPEKQTITKPKPALPTFKPALEPESFETNTEETTTEEINTRARQRARQNRRLTTIMFVITLCAAIPVTILHMRRQYAKSDRTNERNN